MMTDDPLIRLFTASLGLLTGALLLWRGQERQQWGCWRRATPRERRRALRTIRGSEQARTFAEARLVVSGTQYLRTRWSPWQRVLPAWVVSVGYTVLASLIATDTAHHPAVRAVAWALAALMLVPAVALLPYRSTTLRHADRALARCGQPAADTAKRRCRRLPVRTGAAHADPSWPQAGT